MSSDSERDQPIVKRARKAARSAPDKHTEIIDPRQHPLFADMAFRGPVEVERSANKWKASYVMN